MLLRQAIGTAWSQLGPSSAVDFEGYHAAFQQQNVNVTGVQIEILARHSGLKDLQVPSYVWDLRPRPKPLGGGGISHDTASASAQGESETRATNCWGDVFPTTTSARCAGATCLRLSEMASRGAWLRGQCPPGIRSSASLRHSIRVVCHRSEPTACKDADGQVAIVEVETRDRGRGRGRGNHAAGSGCRLFTLLSV